MIQDSAFLSRRSSVGQKLSNSKLIGSLYNFAALNPHLETNEMFQIMTERQNLGVCYSFDQWKAWGRSVMNGKHGIRYYDRMGYRRYVFDEQDTHGESKYRRQAFPMQRILQGLDEINRTSLANSQIGNYAKIEKGVQEYLSSYGYLTESDERNTLMIEGVSYSLYSMTRQPKENISLHKMPFSFRENTELFKSILLLMNVLQGEIQNAYERRRMRAWTEIVAPVEQTGESGADENIVVPQAEEFPEDSKDGENIAEESPEESETDEDIAEEFPEDWETDEDIAEEFPEDSKVGENIAEESPEESETDEDIAEEFPEDWETDEDIAEEFPEDWETDEDIAEEFPEEIPEEAAESVSERKNIVSEPPKSFPQADENIAVPKRPQENGSIIPLWKSYFDEQKKYPHAVILIRLGDFYEVLGEKAVEVSRELDLTLTGRDVGLKERMPMCGFPYHMTEKYVEKILENHSIVYLDGEKEPKYILSAAEARGENSLRNEPRDISSEQREISDEQPETAPRNGYEEDEEWDEDYEEYDYDPSMENDEPPKEAEPSKDKESKPKQGIKQRKKEQPTLFDLFSPQEKSPQDELIEWGVKYGGKERQILVYEEYHRNPTRKEFASFIYKQFGQSGGYTSGKGYSSSPKGLKLSTMEESVFLKWEQVADRVADLIDSESYLSDEAKKLHAAMVRRREERRKAKTEQEKLKVIVEQIIEIGKESSIFGKADFYGRELEESYPFYAERRETVKRMLLERDEILDIEGQHFYTDNTLHLVFDLPLEENGQRRKYNRFKNLREVGKEKLKMYAQSANREPSGTPWGEVQTVSTIANGIYSVSTAGHGGVMIHKDLAPLILSPEALKGGFQDYAFYCYEEDCDACIPLRELYDKGILEQSDYFTHYSVKSEREEAEKGCISFSKATEAEKAAFLEWWNDCINRSLKEYNPDYWTAYQRAEEKIKSTQENEGAELPAPLLESEPQNTDLSSIGFEQKELGGAKARFRGNVEAIRLSRALGKSERKPTQEERKTLARFVGWGALPQAFDERNESWKAEYAELKALFSAEEYEQAKGSTLNAHYTSKEVIDGIFTALKRFGVKGNNRILEPSMGTGNFFGFMPQEISAGAKLYGVELDRTTGQIAAQLYPQAKIQIKGYEETKFPNDYFDIVIGNVPFGGYSVYDSEYAKHSFYIHDYFLAKSIDKLKPNGIMAVITSKGTMDKQNPTVRKYLADRAELLGAIRLPNNAFKQTAGTEVVSDILFFRKQQEKINTTQETDEWIGTGKNNEGYEINSYFVTHPEMILGTLAIEKGLYASEELTVKSDGRELSAALSEAVKNLPENFYENPDFAESEERESEIDFEARPLCYKATNGKLYMRIGDEMVEHKIPKFPHDAYERIKGMIELRSNLRHILDIQIKGCSDSQLQTEQRSLNYRYDSFVRRYGNLCSRVNNKLFKEDGDSALLFACEEIDKKTKEIKKADIFSKRTIRPYAEITSTDDCFEALQICKNKLGKVDISYIEDLTKKDYETVLSELGNTVFRDPTKMDESNKYSGFQSAEEYLSGEVVRKLDLAREYAEKYPQGGFEKNVKALEQVQPVPLTASEISVRLGASWVDKHYYHDFFCELMQANPRRYYDDQVTLFYNPHDSSWRVDQTPQFKNKTRMNQNKVYGTERASARRLFEDALNLRDTMIYDILLVDGTEKRVLNKRETIAAREKQNQIKDLFRKWIFATPERRADLEKTYNALFNQIRLPSYDGSYLRFPQMNPEITLREHQVNAIDRIIVSPKGTLLHHVVGSGKTYTMITAAMKLRQYGIAKKPMFAVPNHLVQQWADSWRKLYPNAHILIAEKEDLLKDKRQRFVSKVALGDWDGIIIAQSSFAKIPVSQERQIAKLQEELDTIELSIREQAEKTGKDHGSVKNLMRIKKSREAALKKLMDDSKKDNVLIFENLGVDYLFIDEAHYYKNLFHFSKMNNVAGINTSSASQRATDLKLKCEYLQKLHGSDRGIVFGTATPISNSMTEMYTMQRYLQPSTLHEIGIDYFDEWATNFGETVTAMEMSPSGQGFRTRTRFSKFVNLPENLKLYRSFSDVQTSEQVKLPVPEVERQTIKLKPSEQILKFAQEIADRAEQIYKGMVDPHVDNMLKVTSDGKKLALDVRCFQRTAEAEEESKVNLCAVKVKEIWDKSKDTRGTQLIFCDLSTPKKPFSDYEYGKDFDVYNELKYKLVKFGIPEREIAFIHDAKTDKEKQALFNAVNNGDVRVFIGSTEKCGAGMNVQKRLIALHHLDTPYRPSDMEQREGRIIRQGNDNKKVQIFTYVMERTFDSYSYQILENKQRFISQINRGDLSVRVAEDIDEATLSYAQIKAITSGNPKILRKMQVDEDIQKLRILESEYLRNLYRLQDLSKIELPEKIRKQELYLSRLRADMELIKQKRTEEFTLSLDGKVYTDRKECAEAFLKAIQIHSEKPFGEICGFTMQMKPQTLLYSEPNLILSANGQYELDLGVSATGNISRLENFLDSIPLREARALEQLENLKNDLKIAEEQLKIPFEKADELKELTKEQAALNEELSLEKKEDVIADPEEEKDSVEKTEDDELENMEEIMTDEVNFMDIPKDEKTEKNFARQEMERISFEKFLDEGLSEILWLNGKTSGFSEDEIQDLCNDLKSHFEDFPEAPFDPDEFDDWYDSFVEDTLEPSLKARGKAEPNFAEHTKQGYAVKAMYDNGERIFAIIERTREDDTDYMIGCGYDPRTGEWAQGIYDFSTYEKAKDYMQKSYPDFERQYSKGIPSDYYEAVQESVRKEYEEFYGEELKKPPEELITRDNYKIRFYNELSVFLGDEPEEYLSEQDVQALYEDSPHILSLLYDYFLDGEEQSINTYEDTAELIKDYNAKYHERIFAEENTESTQKTYLPVYLHNGLYAHDHGELDEYRASYRENENCKNEIESSISKNFDCANLKTDFIDGLIEKYGYDRVMFLCAKTINDADSDGRYSRENKAWARTFPMLDDPNTMNGLDLSTHPIILDGFTSILRKQYQKNQNKEENKMPEKEQENKRTWLTFKVSANAAIRTYENSTFMRMPQDNEELKDYIYNLFNNRMKESTMDEEVKKEPCFEVRMASDEKIRLYSRDGEEKTISAEEFVKLVGDKKADSYRREENKIEFEIPKEAVKEEREKYFILSMPANSKYKGRTFTLPSGAVSETETGYHVSLFENFKANIRWGESEVKVPAEELKTLIGSTSAVDYERMPTQMDDYRNQEGNIVFELNERAIIGEYDRSLLVKMPKGEFSGYTCYIPKKFVVMEEGKQPQIALPEDFNVRLNDRINSRETSLSASEFAAAHKDKKERDYTGFFIKPSEASIQAMEQVEANLRENLPDEMLNAPNWVAVRTRVNPKTNRLDKFLIDVHTDEFAKSDDPATWTDFDTAVEYAKNNGCTALAYALDGKDNLVCLDLDDCIDEKEVCSDTAFDCMENTRGTYCERSVSGKGLHFLGRSDGIKDYKVYSRDGEMELYQKGHFITLTGDVSGSTEIKSFDTPQMKSFFEERFDKREEMKGIGKGVEGLSSMSDRDVLDKAMSAYNGETFKAYYEGKDLKGNHSNSDMAFMNMLAFWCRHDVDQMQRIFATSGLYRPDKSPEYYEHTARKAIKSTPMLTLKKAPSAPKPVNSGGNGKA